MDRNNERQAEEGLTHPQAHALAHLPLPNAAGGVSLDADIFIADVINVVNDLTFHGFDSMEKFIARKLDLKSVDSQRALKQGVDSIYDKIQDNIDESFDRWESICQDLYFSKLPSNPLTVRISEKIAGDASNTCSTASRVEDGQEEALDAELRSLRSQLVAAHKQGAKMRRELTSLEKQLASRKGVLSDAKALEEGFDSDMLAEVMSSADLLRDTILKARSSLDKTSCLQTRPQLPRDCQAATSCPTDLLSSLPWGMNNAEQSRKEELISALKVPSDTEMGDPVVVNLSV